MLTACCLRIMPSRNCSKAILKSSTRSDSNLPSSIFISLVTVSNSTLASWARRSAFVRRENLMVSRRDFRQADHVRHAHFCNLGHAASRSALPTSFLVGGFDPPTISISTLPCEVQFDARVKGKLDTAGSKSVPQQIQTRLLTRTELIKRLYSSAE